jgi:chemotaxis protein MotB
MAAKDDGKRPIIIKKVKKVAGGHHGGAWKVAYADFVTAMMAFFLLLWLLSSSSKETLAGLSEYFTPTQGITGNIGIKDAGGTSPDVQGTKKSSLSQQTIVAGNTPSGQVSENPEKQSKEETQMEDNLFSRGADSVVQAMRQEAMQQYSDNVNVKVTPEGLRIDITDSDKYAMFERGSATLTAHGEKILARMAQIIQKMPNFMAIYGHTDASPAEAGKLDYSNWELSSDRAQSARRFLTKSGIEAERSKKVIGMADRELFTPAEPRGPKNRRIALVMLRGSHILIPDGAVPPKSEGPVVAPPQMPEEPAAPAAAPAAPSAH